MWPGRCAFVLACGLALGWAGSLLLVAVQGGPLSEASANLLATLGGAMAGAVATYLGRTRSDRARRACAARHLKPSRPAAKEHPMPNEKPDQLPNEPDPERPGRPERPDHGLPGQPGDRPDLGRPGRPGERPDEPEPKK